MVSEVVPMRGGCIKRYCCRITDLVGGEVVVWGDGVGGGCVIRDGGAGPKLSLIASVIELFVLDRRGRDLGIERPVIRVTVWSSVRLICDWVV